jgi:transcriptional regulator with XRE-family HTH domain
MQTCGIIFAETWEGFMVKKAAQAKPNELLRNARKERGWTQKDVADRIGAPLALNVTRWERGTAFPSAYYVERLCHLFDKSASELGLIQDQSSQSPEPSNDATTAPTQLLQPSNDATMAPTQLLSPPQPPRPGQPSQFGQPPQFRQPPQLPSRNPLTPKIVLLVGLVLLLVVTCAGLLYITYGNRNSTQHLPVAKPTRAISAIDATATAHVGATATFVAAYPDPYPPYTGKIAFYDPLTAQYLWSSGTNSTAGITCQYVQGAYHAIESNSNGNGICLNDNFDGANITMEVQMKIIQGDCGGIVLRSNEPQDYMFVVCRDGTYTFFAYDNATSKPRILISKTSPSPAIIVGYNQVNVIAVVAKGNTFDLYANQQKIDTVHDSRYSDGAVGLLSTGPASGSTDVVYSHVKIWRL